MAKKNEIDQDMVNQKLFENDGILNQKLEQIITELKGMKEQKEDKQYIVPTQQEPLLEPLDVPRPPKDMVQDSGTTPLIHYINLGLTALSFAGVLILVLFS